VDAFKHTKINIKETLMNSLVGFLANKLSTHPENIATEAFNFILDTSPESRKAFLDFISTKYDIELPADINFKTQQSEITEKGRPDIIGTTFENKRAIVVEVKFWAGLTENQPINYMDYLPSDSKGILLFISPHQRLVTLWRELNRRCKDKNISVLEQSEFSGIIDGNKILALSSWRTILGRMIVGVEDSGNSKSLSDLRQLYDFTEYMDTSGFLPLHDEELSESIPKRTRQFAELVDGIAEKAMQNGASVNSSKHYGWYGKVLKKDGVELFYTYDESLWATFAATPLWIPIGHNIPSARRLYQEMINEDPDSIFIDEQWKRYVIPLYLATGCEFEEVRDRALSQIERIHGRLIEFKQIDSK
jgi:hypothetical protein